jgi:hypothetical protein
LDDDTAIFADLTHAPEGYHLNNGHSATGYL